MGGPKANKKKEVKESTPEANVIAQETEIDIEVRKKKEAMDKLNKIQDEQLKSYESKLVINGGALGHASLVVVNFKDIVKIVDCKGGYVYNAEKCLYERKDNDHIIYMITDYMDTFVGNMMKDYIDTSDKTEDIIKLGKILKQIRDGHHCDTVFKLAKSRLTDVEFEAKLNRVKNLLPIRNNQVIDLKTLKVRKRTQEDLFSFEIDVDFIESPEQLNHATKFFSELMKGNQEVTQYLQKVLGYCLTGETDQRSIFIAWGKGSNGKSTMMDLMKSVMGKFYVPVDKKVFIKDNSSGGSHTAHLIPLINARCAVYSETEDGDKLNAGLIKSLTGGDEISARQLYGTQFSFRPVAKYVILTNEKVEININDDAMVDRFVYLPFEARFVDNPKNGEFKRDVNFIESLKSKYLDEIFSWLCIGAYQYYSLNGGKIHVPDVLRAKTNEYISELDTTSQFVEEKCETREDGKVNRSTLYNTYREWMVENNMNVKIIKPNDFYKRLEYLGFNSTKTKDGTRCFKGLIIHKVKNDSVFDEPQPETKPNPCDDGIKTKDESIEQDEKPKKKNKPKPTVTETLDPSVFDEIESKLQKGINFD